MGNVATIALGVLWASGFAVAQAPSALTDAMPRLRDAPRVALRNVRVVDGSGSSARPNQTVIVAFARANGRVVVGSDPAAGGDARMPGVAALDTLKRGVAAGFSPLDMIRMATFEGARFLQIDKRTGSIAAGKEADLLVIRGAPDQNIEDVDHMEIVFSNGVAYEPQALLARVKGQVRRR